MRIAISAENKNGMDSPTSHHFGRCPAYVLIDIEDGGSKKVNAIDNPFFQGHQPGMVPEFIHSQGVDVMISGGMGRRAIQFFQGYGIEVATGANGTVQATLDAYLRGDLLGANPCAGHVGEQHHHDCD